MPETKRNHGPEAGPDQGAQAHCAPRFDLQKAGQVDSRRFGKRNSAEKPFGERKRFMIPPGKKSTGIFSCLIFCLSIAAMTGENTDRTTPGEHESGVTGGVAVCLGYDDTLAFSELKSFKTQILESDLKTVTDVADRIMLQRLGNRVSVKHWEKEFLPYADNLVDLIICPDKWSCPADLFRSELDRVLAPRRCRGHPQRRKRRPHHRPAGSPEGHFQRIRPLRPAARCRNG